jgi:antitoxin component YwqK of YwqJK toxin-antitoxin module
MKKQSSIILIVCFLALCCGSREEKTRESVLIRYPDGQKREVLFYAGHPNEQLVKEVVYYEDGQLKSETHFKDGKNHGEKSGWYESGQKKFEIPYQNGKKHGRETWWYENGDERSETHFKNGQKHGRETWWYEPNGKNRRHYRADYENGKKHGKERRWDEDGKLDWEGVWKNGRLIKYRGRNIDRIKTPAPPDSP